MTIQMTEPGTQSRNLWRSTGAIVLGIVAIVLLSLGTDEVLHILQVYPPWGQPMHLGPAWYPISLVITALPFCWLGGALYRKMAGSR
jgi:hypothetical protein